MISTEDTLPVHVAYYGDGVHTPMCIVVDLRTPIVQI
jgi:hypothetical protein